jgi:4-hydroxy-tetrahydrodipicolinate synthase
MTKKAAFRGSITALVTPFKDGKFDEATYHALIDWQIESGTHGLSPAGTTGESPTLSHAEHRAVIAACVKGARGRVPVIAGTGSNNTAEAIELSRFAESAGADGLLVVAPYYTSPRRRVFICIIRRSTMRSACRSSFTISRPGRSSTSPSTPCAACSN